MWLMVETANGAHLRPPSSPKPREDLLLLEIDQDVPLKVSLLP